MDSIDYSTPEGLLHFLEAGPPKTCGSFQEAEGEGRCCLGWYAELNNIPYDRSDQIFVSDKSEREAVLPYDHWLFSTVVTPHGNCVELQIALSSANDEEDNFHEVINILSDYISGVIITVPEQE